MKSLPSRGVIARRVVLVLAAFPVAAAASNVRIVTYNTQDDVTNNSSPNGPLQYLETVLEGVGQEQYVGDSILKLPDIIALQETTSNANTSTPIATALDKYYNNPNLYASSPVQGTQSGSPTVGNGPNALVYNAETLNLIASVGVGTPTGSGNGEYRQVMRYEFQPLVDKGTNTGTFYVYDQHAKSGSASMSAGGSTDGNLRYEEAVIVRNDEATLPTTPTSPAVIYVGDFNVDGSTDASYQTYTGQGTTPAQAQGAGIDPLNASDNYTLNYGSSTFASVMTESDDYLDYRDDFQLMTNNIYNGATGVLTYVSGSLHAFGNNGGTAYHGNINSPSNTALNDINTVTRSNALPAGSLTSTQVLAAMNNSIGSDHLPVVADYTIAGFNNGIWNGGTGNWSNFTFWTNEVVPVSNSLEVKIDNANTIASVVTLDVNATILDLTLDANDTLGISSGFTLNMSGPVTSVFNGTFTNTAGILNANAVSNTGAFNSSGTYAGAGTFTNRGTVILGGTQNWSSGVTFINNAGTAMFNTDAGSVNRSNLSVNVSGGTVTFASTQHLSGLNISSGGLVQVARTAGGSRSVLVVASTPAIAGTLDLAGNDLDVANAGYTPVLALVKSGYNAAGGGYWNGTGIASTTAASNTTHLTALGIIQNNQGGPAIYSSGHPFDGVAPGPSDILVKYTYLGDTNLDGKIDGTDYGRVDNGFLAGATDWYDGDFNYDGIVNGSDYTLIDNAFNTQNGVISAAIASPDVSVTAEIAPALPVPEPATGALMGIGALALLRRRRP